MTNAAPTSFGPYRVKTRIGRGGMGEVYLAEDPRLKRDVAIKTLPPQHALDPDRRARFLNEARAASALQHPNIVTIFDLGSDGGIDFIVMEFVEGRTLREMLGARKPDLRTALEIAAQVANGLAAAHAAGIVHRDLKPENLIVGSDGCVKILDYGVAKLLDYAADSGPDESTAAAPAQLTAPGSLVGTITYMSPEQVEGRKIDHRTDIFALGLVLCEMVSGRNPVAGASNAETMQKIVNAPPPVERIGADLPPRVIDIVQRALASNPIDRYQSARDMELDLRQAIATLHQTLRPALQSVRAKWWPAWVVVACAAGLAAGFSIARHAQPVKPAGPRIAFTPLTTDPGYEGEPTFTPDGQSIAYVSDRSGNLDIYLRQTTGGPDINLTNDPADDVQPSLSPDGKQIAFVSTRGGATPIVYRNATATAMGGDIWVMPALGGTPRRVVERGNYPSWSPDGRAILFTAGPWGQQRIFRIPATGGDPVAIPVRLPRKHLFVTHSHYSPDGKWIAFHGQVPPRIYIVAASGGDARLIGPGSDPVWQGDSLIYSNEEPGRNGTLWRVHLHDGKPDAAAEPVTAGRGVERTPAVSADGTTIAFSAQNVAFNIERLALDRDGGKVAGSPAPLTSGSDFAPFFDVSPDGRFLVFESRRAGKTHIWRKDMKSGAIAQLTADTAFEDMKPRWSPNGSQVAFSRTEGDTTTIWIMDGDGGNPRMISSEYGDFPTWTSDGKGIIYYIEARKQDCVVDIRTRAVHALTNEPRTRSGQILSADGIWLAYLAIGTADTTDIHVMPTAGGPPIIAVATPHEDLHPFFSRDGRWLYFQQDHKNIYRVPGPAQDWPKAIPQQVTSFPESNLYLEDPELSADGKYLLYSRRTETSDIWLGRFER